MASFLDSRLVKPQALTYYANQVKRLGRQAGATVQIVQAQEGGRVFFLAGINSSARWSEKQLALLASWGVAVAPTNFPGKITLELGGDLHAEENMAMYLDSIGAKGLRWSRAVVGAHYDTKSGSRSYVCANCRALVQRVGGAIEPPF